MVIEELEGFDAALRAAFEELSGIALSNGQWDRAGRRFLGFFLGGLGLRHSARHAHAAHISFHAATLELCQALDPGFVWKGGVQDSWLRRAG